MPNADRRPAGPAGSRAGGASVHVRGFHVLAKPRGAICNLACTYCFYSEKADLYRPSRFHMSDEVLEAYTSQVFEDSPGPVAQFAWQGGEPTLMGLEFFRKAVGLQRELCPPGRVVENALQTNGVLLDDDWCEFLAEHQFLVGLSLDGPRDLHDAQRLDHQGRPTFDRVMEALRRLQRHGVEFNILTTVTATNAGHPLEVYRFLRDDAGVQHIQFIPVVERPPGSPQVTDTPVADYSVGSSDYGQFLVSVFDEWVHNDIGSVFVQIFESTLSSMVGLQAGLCVFSETCGASVALEHNGDVYACDHFVTPEHRRGNLLEARIADLVASKDQVAFGQDKRDLLPVECLSCDVLRLCWGGCPKNRLIETGEPGHPLNHLCASYRQFFGHVTGPLSVVAEVLASRRPAADAMELIADLERRRFARVGRNDPCPCGSGRKRKLCGCIERRSRARA